jgi:hypothetical protein
MLTGKRCHAVVTAQTTETGDPAPVGLNDIVTLVALALLSQTVAVNAPTVDVV